MRVNFPCCVLIPDFISKIKPKKLHYRVTQKVCYGQVQVNRRRNSMNLPTSKLTDHCQETKIAILESVSRSNPFGLLHSREAWDGKAHFSKKKKKLFYLKEILITLFSWMELKFSVLENFFSSSSRASWGRLISTLYFLLSYSQFWTD